MTERDRSQIYLQMTHEILREWFIWAKDDKPTEVEYLTEWNKRFAHVAQNFGVDR